MTYKDKLQHLKEHLLERHSNLTDYVESLTGDVKEVVELILEIDHLYDIFKVNGSFEDYERVIYQVVHALEDDGEMVVKRYVNEQITDLYQKINEIKGTTYEVPYEYVIEENHSYETRSVTADQLKRLLATINPHVEYYKKHEDLVEKVGTEEFREYFRLSKMTNKMFEEIYKENQYDN